MEIATMFILWSMMFVGWTGTLPAIADMTGVYVICLVIGGGMLVISTVLGGHGHTDLGGVDGAGHVGFDAHADAPTGMDVHTDVPGHVDTHGGDFGVSAHHGWAWSNWFSVQFVVYATATFGMVGTILTYLSDWPAEQITWTSLISGLLMGQLVHQIIRKIRRTEAVLPVSPAEFVGKIARVTVSVVPPGMGEVAVMVRGSEHFLPVRTKHDHDKFLTGSEVAIASLSQSVAEVVSPQEYEFISDSKT